MRLIDADKLFDESMEWSEKLKKSADGQEREYGKDIQIFLWEHVKTANTAFDLESVIMEMERISKDMQSEANDLASIGYYGCATKFEGMSQAYKDCVNILKSAANATNGKNGG